MAPTQHRDARRTTRIRVLSISEYCAAIARHRPNMTPEEQAGFEEAAVIYQRHLDRHAKDVRMPLQSEVL